MVELAIAYFYVILSIFVVYVLILPPLCAILLLALAMGTKIELRIEDD